MPAVYIQPNAAIIGLDNWWLDSVFSDIDWRAVYHPLGADDLADSYTNLVTPGTNDAAPGSAPTHDPARGWIFSISRYLDTGLVPNSDWTMLVRFSNASVNGGIVAGSNTTGQSKRLYLFPRLTTTDLHAYANGDTSVATAVPRLTGGVMAIAGKDGYLNGVLKDSAAAGDWEGDHAIYIGAFNGSGTAANFFSGDVQAVAIAASTLTAEQVEAATAWLMSLSYAPSTVITSTRYEMFLDDYFVETMSAGLTRSINKPTKHGSNPVTTAVAGASDYGNVYVETIKFGATDWRMWTNSAEDAGSPTIIRRRLSYYTSSDGISWTKPNMGLVSYTGDTNNNILLDDPTFNVSVIYDAARAAGTQFLGAFAEYPAASDQGIYILKASDGINWTLHKTVVTDAIHGAHLEAADLVERDDGRWLAYYATGQGNNTRSIGAYLSDTTSLTGTWTHQGIIIPTAGPGKQRYSLGVDKYLNTWIGFCMQYQNAANEGLMQMDLAVSHDGLEWTIVDEAWIPRGGASDWDSDMIFAGRSFVHTGDEWWFYYCGFEENHHEPQPRDAQVGIAVIDYGRIGEVSGPSSPTNNLVTTVFEPEAGTSLYVNCDASGGGSIGVAVLDESGAAIAGYAKTDMDVTLNSDTIETEITWDGETLPAQRIKLKFDINDAILYSYRVE